MIDGDAEKCLVFYMFFSFVDAKSQKWKNKVYEAPAQTSWFQQTSRGGL